MNIFRWIYVTLAMLPRDVMFTNKYISIIAQVNYWDMRHWTIHQVFDKVAKKNPEKIAIRLDDQAWTFQMLYDYSLQVANYFHKQGYKKGSVVALFMQNQPKYVGVWLGLSRLGVITALVNTGQPLKSLSHAVTVANSEALICDTQLLKALVDLQASEWKLPETVRLFRSGPEAKGVKLEKSEDLDVLLEQESALKLPREISKQLRLRDKMVYIYTSGTTGLPKAALMSYHRFAFLAVAINTLLKIKKNDVLYTPMPLFHSSGGMVGTGQTLLYGTTMVTKIKFSASRYIPDCRKYGVTVGQYIGEMCTYMMAKDATTRDKDHKLRLIFGNGMRLKLWNPFKERFGVKQIGEFYGSTEGNTNMVNSWNQPGSCGFVPWFLHPLYPLYLLKYDSESGLPLRGPDGFGIQVQTGEPGLLVGAIRKKSVTSQFQGYADKKATDKKIENNLIKTGDQYFNSGDVLKQDEYGYFYFVDRLGDTFRWKGENIAASQVEEVISTNMDMRSVDVVVYGVKVGDSEGKAGMATLAMDKNKLVMEKLKTALESNLLPQAIPLFLRVTNTEIERTDTEKIRKVNLQKQGFDLSQLGNDADSVYLYRGKAVGYVQLTQEIYDKIMSGEEKL